MSWKEKWTVSLVAPSPFWMTMYYIYKCLQRNIKSTSITKKMFINIPNARWSVFFYKVLCLKLMHFNKKKNTKMRWFCSKNEHKSAYFFKVRCHTSHSTIVTPRCISSGLNFEEILSLIYLVDVGPDNYEKSLGWTSNGYNH